MLVACRLRGGDVIDPVRAFFFGLWVLVCCSCGGRALRVRGEERPPEPVPEPIQIASRVFTNPNHAMDTNGDENISPVDALLISSYLNSHGLSKTENIVEDYEFYLDVNHDGIISSVDALLVMDDLNTRGSRSVKEEKALPLAVWPSSVVSTLSEQIRTRYAFENSSSVYENSAGMGEKWLRATRGSVVGWYVLLPSGLLYSWSESAHGLGRLVDVLAPQHFANPSALMNI